MNILRRATRPLKHPIESEARGLQASKGDKLRQGQSGTQAQRRKKKYPLPPDPRSLEALSPANFEILVASVLESMGFENVVPLGGAGDSGVDIRAEWRESLPTGHVRSTLWAIQCKKYSRPLTVSSARLILNSVLEFRESILPSPPDYFLIATSSHFTPDSRALIESANRNRTRYGCHFLTLDGQKIASEIANNPRLMDNYLTKRDGDELEGIAAARLTVLVDKLPEKSMLTFLYDEPGENGTSLAARAELAGDLALLSYPGYHDAEGELSTFGEELWRLIPSLIRDKIFDSPFIRLVSNDHSLPFELAYDASSDRLLGYRTKIGRIQINSIPPIRKFLTSPSILLAGAPRPYDRYRMLIGASREIKMLHQLLMSRGFSVEEVTGSDLTRAGLLDRLNKKSFNIIHLALFSDPEMGVLTSDGFLEWMDIGSLLIEGSLVFLSTGVSLERLNDISRKFFAVGASAIIGFVCNVRDRIIGDFALFFYEALSLGENIGSALEIAKSSYMIKYPEDLSWAFAILFGEPTLSIKTSPPT